MNDDLEKLILENQKLLRENLELSKKNAKRIKQIHAYMRRTFVAKVIYWLVIIAVTAGAVYFVRPYVESAVSSYNNFSETLSKTTEVIDNPGSLFQDVGILNKLFSS